MFKKVLQSLTKSMSSKPAKKRRRPEGSVLDKVKNTGKTGGARTGASSRANATPEQICEIKPGMSKDEVHARIKLLYRRFNRSASSLDPHVREEAERMLAAIVAVREKYIGAI